MKLTFFEKLEQFKNSSKEVYINNIYQNENLTYKNLRFVLLLFKILSIN